MKGEKIMPAKPKFLSSEGLLYYWQSLKTMLANKVDKQTGKGLSTNDYSTAEKTKLTNIAAGAQVNVIQSIKVNNVAQGIDAKAVNITVPIATSDLTNDSNFVVDENYVHTDNNYTITEKNKLNGVAAGAQANVIESIKVNNTAQTVTNKAVNITVPENVSDLTNDLNFASDANYVHTDNNYTTTEKTKLNGIADGADENIIQTIKVNNAAQTVTNKEVNITVPTNNNQLTNGAGYQTASDVSTAIAAAVGQITGFSFSIVQALPATGTAGTIYLIAHSHDTNDGYDEYIWVNNAFEKLGHTDVDLSGYVETTNVITNAQIDTILAS